MNYAGISTKLMSFADVLTGHLPGGLAQVNVLLSMLMGGVSGSANADAAMQCKMLVPEMEKRGLQQGLLSGDHGGVLSRYAGNSAGNQPDCLCADCRRFSRKDIHGRLYAGYFHGHLPDDYGKYHFQETALCAEP